MKKKSTEKKFSAEEKEILKGLREEEKEVLRAKKKVTKKDSLTNQL